MNSITKICAIAFWLILTGILSSCSSSFRNNVSIEEKDFGTLPEGNATLWIMENEQGMKVAITDYGAAITEIHVKDRNGKSADVVCGFDSVEKYTVKNNLYFGGIVGRYGNRIANGRFKLDGQTYQLSTNNELAGISCHFHGGNKGFDKLLWKGKVVKHKHFLTLQMTLNSPDGDEGYPGRLRQCYGRSLFFIGCIVF